MVTIIIPTYNEEKNIIKLQKQLDNLNGNFEVIFSDGFSNDNTYSLIYYPKIQETKFRANQMNAAVKYANGDYIWFLHCDSKIDKNSIKIIENSHSNIGCFSLDFDSKNILLKIIAFFSNLRVKHRNIAFGDQGIFIKKSIFYSIGKYEEIPIMEDYSLSMKIKNYGLKIKILNTKIITSPRRFKKNGIIKTCILMQKLQHMFRRKHNINEIYEKYK